MKHYGIVTIALGLLICASVFAADANKIVVSDVRAEAENVIVPINLSNSMSMVALDLPLKFSEGVSLVDVSFEGTRSEDFDFKWANINNDDNTVVIGLIPMVYGENKDLAPGEGVIANLEFSIETPGLEYLEIEPTVIDKPSHELMFVYAGQNNEMKDTEPEFPEIRVALSQVVPQEALPTKFDLRQNAPNPFNPTTTFWYDLPQATHVRLDIYNVLGQRVNTLVDDYQEAGYKSVVWNGTDSHGYSVASGMYFYRIEAGEFSKTMKMMMLK